jgi:hypothetical protein
MMRHVKLLLAALLVAFSAASIAEAAPKKVVRQRPRHSTRVATGATATTGSRATARHRAAPKKKRASATRSTTKKKAAARKKSATAARRRATTKPR